MKNHERLLAEAKKAINAVHGDMTIPLSTTLESLKDLQEEVNLLIDAVRTSMENM